MTSVPTSRLSATPGETHAAEAQFRRVKGYRQLPQLLTALEAATADQPGTDTLDQRVAG